MPRQAQSLQVVATIKLQVLAQAGTGSWPSRDDDVPKPGRAGPSRRGQDPGSARGPGLRHGPHGRRAGGPEPQRGSAAKRAPSEAGLNRSLRLSWLSWLSCSLALWLAAVGSFPQAEAAVSFALPPQMALVWACFLELTLGPEAEEALQPTAGTGQLPHPPVPATSERP